MTTSYPTNIDTLTNPAPGDSEVTVSHSGQHSNANDAIEAIETQVGTTAQETALNVATTRGKMQNHITNHPSGASLSIVTKGGTFIAPTGLINAAVWRAPFACTVTFVRMFVRTPGATACVGKAQKRTSAATIVDLCPNISTSLNLQWVWFGAPSIINTAFAVGDTLEIQYVSGSPPAQVSIQVDFSVP